MNLAGFSILLLGLVGAVGERALAQQDAASDASAALAQAADASAEADPLASLSIKGSQIPHEEIRCAACHSEPALWEGGKLKLFVSTEVLERDVHWQKGVACSDCHGGNHASLNYAEAHAGLVPLRQLRERCAHCHKDEQLGLVKGVHAKAGDKDDVGRGSPLACLKCHGSNAHEIFPATDERSPVYLDNQVRMCGSCHAEDQATYGNTVHGRGLYRSGLKVTAVCADCHGSHGIYYAADGRSTLHPASVAKTCCNCHQSIEGRLEKSVHGRGQGSGPATELTASVGKITRQPSCTDCHQGHHLLYSELPEFRLLVASGCGNCHADLSSRYALSMHGELTRQGHSAAANCADCHGAHDILPVNDTGSRVAPGKNRLRTCQKCHAHAVMSFTRFDPHANFKDAARFPRLHAVYSGIKYSINIFFACFLVHSFLWFMRAFIDRLQYGAHATLISEHYALPRFGSMHRAIYAVLLVSFFGLTVTGLALKHSSNYWGQWLASGLGGFQSASDWHHFFAVMAIVACGVYLTRAVTRIVGRRREHNWKTIVLGPDSLVPNGRDLRDSLKMFLWFIGFGPKPGFERWTYWEKLEYWAFYLGAGLIGGSGLLLWYPNLFCLVLPGNILNVAKVVHTEFAIYTASILFLIHFFHAHFRPEKFPLDLSVLTGLVSEEHLRKYRPEYVARLEVEGRLENLRQEAPSKRNLWLNIAGGLLVFTLGCCVLAVTLLASLEE